MAGEKLVGDDERYDLTTKLMRVLREQLILGSEGVAHI